MLPTALPAAFFLSGAAGLIFQIVWFYRCSLVFGSGVAAVTVVLSAFMAGLAIGSAAAARYGRRLTRPLLAYALLEAIVAIAGVAVTVLLPHAGAVLAPAVRRLGGLGPAVDALRFLAAFVLLTTPAVAMGATLPVLVNTLHRAGAAFGPSVGRLYGWNTLGAVAGTLLAELVLIRLVGVMGAAVAAAGLNAIAAGAAVALRRSAGDTAADRQMPDPAAARLKRNTTHGRVWPILIAAALCGGSLLGLEVIWFRFLSMYVLVTTLAMSLMLAVVLGGIGAGGLAGSWWLRQSGLPASSLPVISCGAGCFVIACYALFHALTSGTQVGEWWRVLWFAFVLAAPVSFLSGILFTYLAESLFTRTGDSVLSAGSLAATNTVGALVGPPLTTYVLLPHAGVEGSLFVVALIYLVIAALTSVAFERRSSRTEPAKGRARWTADTLPAAAGLALLLALLFFPFGAMNRYYVARAAAAYDDDGSTVVATREGPSETLFVMQQQWLGEPVYSRLITNGFSMSGTALQGQRYMRAFAYYPMLLHDGPLARALVVCYGVGVTLGAVTHIPSVERIDVAEISRDVVSMSDVIYPGGTGPLHDPRVHLHIEDGRFFLQTTSGRFDLITGEPPPPRTPGTVNIYTSEYFQLVHDRLADGGIATYWLPVARPRPGTDVNTIIRAFCDVFEDCSLWNATPFDLMLVGSRGLSGPRSAAAFSAPWQTPGLEARLREVGFERPEQIGATFLGDGAWLRQLTSSTPPLTDDFPQRLRPDEARASLSDPRYGTDPAVSRMYAETLDPARARAAFAASPLIGRLWPAGLVERSLPYFDQQSRINRVYWEGGHPLAQIDDLDAVLSTTTLRTLPLWMLGSDDVKERIAESVGTSAGELEYARALRALSGRDYAGAVQWLTAAEGRGMHAGPVVPLRAYALLKLEQFDAVRRLAGDARPSNAEERHFWEWIRRASG
jgi:predicted membrane-bound spermidine synthase